MTKKYEILSEVFSSQGHYGRHGLSRDDVADIYNGLTFTDPEIIDSFDTEAEAHQAFEEYKNGSYSYDRGAYAEFKILLLWETEYDDDGDPVMSWDIDFYAEPIKAKVIFEGGESRDNPGEAVDYMLVTLTDGTELYAETEAVEDNDWYNFDGLKAEIIKQAEENGIDPDRLYFIGD
jgi:hypothetical protein